MIVSIRALATRGDGETLPFADNSFDVTACFRLLCGAEQAAHRVLQRRTEDRS
ncbi:MAG: methyltransferase domain-containing protein [Chloroflexi bacterium]|nr:methyltransferase domain-containing protein [Chloroflexota bacterium]